MNIDLILREVQLCPLCLQFDSLQNIVLNVDHFWSKTIFTKHMEAARFIKVKVDDTVGVAVKRRIFHSSPDWGSFRRFLRGLHKVRTASFIQDAILSVVENADGRHFHINSAGQTAP